MKVLENHLFPLYYNLLQTLNNNDNARNLKGVGLMNLNDEDANLKVSGHFSNAQGVVVLSAFNGDGGTITLTPTIFSQWGDKQIVQMSGEVFQAAHSNGYGFFVDSEAKDPLTAELQNHKDRLDAPYKQYKIKLRGKDVLDMKININRYSIGEYLSMSDEVFTLTSKSNSGQELNGTYAQLNYTVKENVNIHTIFSDGLASTIEGTFMKDYLRYYSPKIKDKLKAEGIEIYKDNKDGKIHYTSKKDASGNLLSIEELNKKIQTYTMQLISEDILAQRSDGITWDDNEEVKNVRMGDVFTNKEIIRIFGYSEKNKRGIHFVDKKAMSGGKADEAFIGKDWDLLTTSFNDKDFAIITVGVRLNPTDVMPKNTNLTGEQKKYFFNKYREMFNPNSLSNTGQSEIQTATTR